MNTRYDTPRTPCEAAVAGLFDEHGPAEILRALARRLAEEAAVAHGEGDHGRFARWSGLAGDCETSADVADWR